jgi:hypothetical protein
MSRKDWLSLANQAARDPSRASQLARVLLDKIDTEGRTGGEAPEGYLYAGADTLIAKSRDLVVESLQTRENPTGVPIWTTASNEIPIKIPFDCWIYGVAGWSQTRVLTDAQAVEYSLVGANGPLCADGRDLFSVDWNLDGQVGFTTDGRKRMMSPASTSTGTRKRPRRMSWTLRRNQVIGVRFRNLWNAIVSTMPSGFAHPVLAEAAVAFYVVNTE